MDLLLLLFVLMYGEDTTYLAHAMIREASIDGEEGMVAVGLVISNRVSSKKWPNTVKNVVYAPSNNPSKPHLCAFSFTCDNVPDIILNRDVNRYLRALELAESITLGHTEDTTLGANHYLRCGIKRKWLKNLSFTVKIGKHCFYRSY